MAKFCTACGASMPDDMRFCTECGAAIDSSPAVPAESRWEPPAPSQPQPTRPAAPTWAPTPPPQQRVRQAPPEQPRYVAAEAAYAPPRAPRSNAVPSPGSPYAPMSVGAFIGTMLLMCIPIVGLVLALVWAFGGCRNVNKRNLARAMLILMAISLVLSLILGFVLRSIVNKAVETIEQETGFALSGDSGGLLSGQDDEDGGGSAGGLLGLLGIGTNENIEELEELEELEGMLEDVEGLTGENYEGLNELIDDAQDINREAELANDGWPPSLRAYPGGTARAVASYRTEITDTSLEEMQGWIDDLRKDGFQYQDFYDFGMSEEDMLSVNGWWATDGDIYLSLSWDGEKVIIDHMKELPDMSSLLG